MSKSAVTVAAFALSAAACLVYEIGVQRQMDAQQQTIAMRRAELKRLNDFDAQVVDFQKKKNRLQRRIDLINALYGTRRAEVKKDVAAMFTVDGVDVPIEIARVVDANTIEARTPSGVTKLKVKY